MQSLTDTKGRPWAKLSQVKPGDRLVTDTGFDCLEAGSHLVYQDNHGLSVTCNHGKHYLFADDGEHMIGFYCESVIVDQKID